MSQIQEIKDANDIVELINERIKLQQAGNSFKACCPFHNEKTPSFFVHPQMQRYRCFGCGASGDVLDFLQNYEGISFYEALKELADRAGIKLKEFARSSEDEEREQLLAILDLAKEYYHYLLTDHQAGDKARQYLKDRGTTAESIKLFQLGFSLDSWDGLIKYLHHKKHYDLALIAKTGLIIKGKAGRYYDRFRGRLIFPLKNHRGQVVGFSGRVLDKSIKEAKYINSPETSLYHKSKLLYGYSELFRELKKANKVVIVEGEFDMISSVQAHVNYTLAIKGSALTEEQINLLSRVTQTIILALDADEAGIKATKRAISLVRHRDIDLRVVDLKHATGVNLDEIKDPDDLARSNPKLWRQLVDEAVSVYAYLMNVALDQHDAQTPDGQRQIINQLAPIIKNIDHAVEKEFYLQKLAEALNVKLSLLKTDIERFGDKNTPSKSVQSKPETQASVKTHQQQVEEYLLFLLFKLEPKQTLQELAALQEFNWQTSGAASILAALAKWHQPLVLDKFAKSLAEDLKAKLMDWVLNPQYQDLDQQQLTAEWQQTLQQLRKEALRSDIDQINQEITQLDHKLKRSADEEARLDELLAQIIAKQAQIKN